MVERVTTEPRTTVVERRGMSGGMIAAIVLIAAAAIVAFLFLTGFWSANVSGGALPKVAVSANGGSMPDVKMHSKQIVVGSKQTTIDVPKVETTKAKVDVPVVGVKDHN